VSVVSFNMLLKGFDQKPYYPSVPAEVRAWPRRKLQLRSLIEDLAADIYCMQEVECLSFEEEFSFLAEAGYASVAPKDDSKGRRPDMAKCAIFYKADRFEKLWDDHRSRIVLAAFRHLASEQLLYVASCHLEGAPWEAATRITQIRKALESVGRHQKTLGADPATTAFVVAGDFNETAEEGAVCHCLSNGGLQKSFRSPAFPDLELTKQDFTHGFEMADLYVPGWQPGDACAFPQRPSTFCAPVGPNEEQAEGFSAIDFVFFSRGALRPSAVRRPFTEEQRREAAATGIPAAWHISDHVPIGGTFRFLCIEGGVAAAAPRIV